MLLAPPGMPDCRAAGADLVTALERARASYEALVRSGELTQLPVSGVVAHRLAGQVDGAPVCVELVMAAGGATRAVRRTRIFSPLPPGVAMGFTLVPRRERGSGTGDVGERFAQRFSVSRREGPAFAASGFDRETQATVLAFLDSRGGVLTIGPDLIDWRHGGLDVNGQGEPLLRDFARLAGAVLTALRRGPLGGRVVSGIDPAYLLRRAETPAPTMYVSEKGLVWLYAVLTILGLGLLAAGFLAGPGKSRLAFMSCAVVLLVPGVAGCVLLARHLLSVRPALLP